MGKLLVNDSGYVVYIVMKTMAVFEKFLSMRDQSFVLTNLLKSSRKMIELPSISVEDTLSRKVERVRKLYKPYRK